MHTDLFSLEGRVAVITGGSRGIGKMIAKGFVDHGAKVYITARSAEACAATVAELGENCIALPQDLSTFDGIKTLVAAYQAREDKLDILVNNAGIAWVEKFDAFPEKGWDKVVDVNMKAPFFLTQQFYGALKAARATNSQPR